MPGHYKVCNNGIKNPTSLNESEKKKINSVVYIASLTVEPH